MRNSFNLLLIALICMDSCFLITSIVDCFRKGFFLTTDVHTWMFPYFLHPFISIAVTGSIFMTVAIALERYWAVHYPIDYSQVIRFTLTFGMKVETSLDRRNVKRNIRLFCLATSPIYENYISYEPLV